MNTRGRVAIFQGVLTVAAEVGWLLPFSFQFFTRLAAVFAEEVGDFGLVGFISNVKRCFPFVSAILRRDTKEAPLDFGIIFFTVNNFLTVKLGLVCYLNRWCPRQELNLHPIAGT